MKAEYEHMSIEELREEFDRKTERRRGVLKQAADIHDKAKSEDRELTKGESTKIADLSRGVDNLGQDLEDLEFEITEQERQLDFLRSKVGDPRYMLLPGGPPEQVQDGDPRRYGFREASLRSVDRVHERGEISDEAAKRAEDLVRRGTAKNRDVASKWISTTADPAYSRAFAKLATDPDKGHMKWTREEQDAFQCVEEFRAMSLGGGGTAGFLVPFQLDPAIILTSAGSINPLRQISRVVTATSDVWHGVSSAGVTAEWIAEATEVADAAPTLAQPTVPVHKGDAFVPFSFEVGMDSVDLMGELSPLLTDAADQLQATAYTTGSGTGQPTGIIKALEGGSSLVTPTTAETFAAADVYKVQNALPPRFQGRMQWAANIAILNTMAQHETTNGARLFPELGDGRLLRKPINELSNMDGTIDPAATANNYVLLYGAFDQFVIADRIGTTVEFIQNLVGANRRPTGQRGVLMWFRTGSDSVNDNAFRLLNVATTA